jgi:exopolysaccharide production protein ExoZ
MLYSLQYLRAVAASMIVIYHIGFIFGGDWRPLAAGVDIFFVISGFIMWYITTGKRPPSVKQFLVDRIIKVVPPYWIFTLVFVAAAMLAPTSIFRWALDVPEILKSLLFIPYFSTDGKLEPVLGVGWTLNFEIYFYAVFAIALCIHTKFRLAFILTFLTACAVMSVAKFENAVLLTYTSPLVLEFAGGVLIAAWLRSEGRLPTSVAVLLIVAGLLAIATVSAADSHGAAFRLVRFGLPAIMIVLGCLAIEKNKKPEPIEWLRFLGDASYSIYLTHIITIGAFKYVFSKLGLERWGSSLTQQTAMYLIALAGCMAVGVVCHVILERPLHKWLRQRLTLTKSQQERQLIASQR